jgi:hypothetical protein
MSDEGPKKGKPLEHVERPKVAGQRKRPAKKQFNAQAAPIAAKPVAASVPKAPPASPRKQSVAPEKSAAVERKQSAAVQRKQSAAVQRKQSAAVERKQSVAVKPKQSDGLTKIQKEHAAVRKIIKGLTQDIFNTNRAIHDHEQNKPYKIQFSKMKEWKETNNELHSRLKGLVQGQIDARHEKNELHKQEQALVRQNHAPKAPHAALESHQSKKTIQHAKKVDAQVKQEVSPMKDKKVDKLNKAGIDQAKALNIKEGLSTVKLKKR